MGIKNLLKLGCILVFSAFFSAVSGQSSDDLALKEIEKHRKEQTATLKSKTSPLPIKERKKFKGLKYYPANLNYRVEATFVKHNTPVLFKMKTTTTRLPDYIKYGEAHFTIQNQNFVLEVYQSPDVSKMKGYENHLFIPFTDETNGEETYEVGRYIDITIPTDDKIILDFNLSYNPYCSYNANYSCPIPPEANHLSIAITAGEMKYKKR